MKRTPKSGTARGITIIQFMFVLLVVGIAAYWLVEYLRGRLA